MYVTKEVDVEVEIDEFKDYEVLRHARYLIEGDKSNLEYFEGLIEPEFKFDFLNDLYNIEYKKIILNHFLSIKN